MGFNLSLVKHTCMDKINFTYMPNSYIKTVLGLNQIKILLVCTWLNPLQEEDAFVLVTACLRVNRNHLGALM